MIVVKRLVYLLGLGLMTMLTFAIGCYLVLLVAKQSDALYSGIFFSLLMLELVWFGFFIAIVLLTFEVYGSGFKLFLLIGMTNIAYYLIGKLGIRSQQAGSFETVLLQDLWFSLLIIALTIVPSLIFIKGVRFMDRRRLISKQKVTE